MTEYTPRLTDYVAAIVRRTGLMLSIAVPITLTSVIIATGLPDIYRSKAVIDIEETKIPGYTESLARDRSYADKYVAGLSDVVLSRDGLLEIVEKFDPYPDLKHDLPQTLGLVRADISVDMVTTQVLDPYSSRSRAVITAFSVSYFSRDPEVAHQVAAWLANAYLAADRRNRQQRASGSAEFFRTEAERVRNQIAGLEAKLADFKERNFGRLPELTGMNMNVMDRTERDVDAVRLQMSNLQRDRVFLARQLEDAQSVNPDAGMLYQLEQEYKRKAASYDDNHPDLISLRRRIETLRLGGPASVENSLQAQLEAEKTVLAQARQRYSDDHPDIRRILRTIESLEKRIAAGEKVDVRVAGQTQTVVQLKTQINAIDTQLSSLQAREVELRQKLQDLQSRIESTPEVELGYLALTRDIELARKQYEELLRQQMDAEVRGAAIEGGSADEFRLIQPPYTPSGPAKPNRSGIVVVGMMLALALSVTVALVAELLDPKVRGSADLQRLVGTPFAVVPLIRNSAFRRQRIRKAAIIAAAYLLGVPLAYLTVYIVAW